MKKISIITGASSGLGYEFARMIDQRESCEEIWVIARRIEKLNEIKSETGKKIIPIGLDLSREESIAEYKKLLSDADAEVVALVNAAGVGKIGKFEDIPLEDQMSMIDLNCKALMAVTYITLPYMKKGSHVYEIASLAAFQPVPYISTYAATKAFVLSFSRALNKELESKGIKIISICPGWIDTGFIDKSTCDDSVTNFKKLLTVDEVIDQTVRDTKKGRDVSVAGRNNKIRRILAKILPHTTVMKIWCGQQEK